MILIHPQGDAHAIKQILFVGWREKRDIVSFIEPLGLLLPPPECTPSPFRYVSIHPVRLCIV